MDFFEYARIARLFINQDTWWLKYLVGALTFAIVYIFEAIALYVIGTREGYKNRWMAFVPFFNTYYVGVCAQKNRFMKFDTKKVALVLAVLDLMLCIANSIDCAAEEMLRSAGCIIEVDDYYGTLYELTSVPASLAWAAWCFTYLSSYILVWVKLIYYFIFVIVISCFFQTYSAKRYFIFTITSLIFPIQGILFFAVRNNKGMSYSDYIRREQERNYQMYQQYNRQNYNQNPYSRNPYDNVPPPSQGYGGQGAPSGQNADPFDEFGSNNGASPEDPFDEFKN